MDSGASGCAYISSRCYEKFSSLVPNSALRPVRSLTSFGGKETQSSRFEVELVMRGAHGDIQVDEALPFIVLESERLPWVGQRPSMTSRCE